MIKWLSLIFPKEMAFFPLFDEQARQLAAAARALKEHGTEVGEAIAAVGRASAEAERRALGALRGTFVTPFDRTDIKALVTALSAATDALGEVARGLSGAPGLRDLPTVGRLIDLIADVVLACHAAMAVGTLVRGWRIVHTMGSKITRLKPFQGFSAELGGAATVFAAIGLGAPISTTHTIAGAITGVGAVRPGSSVRWNVAGEIVFA